MVRGGLTCLLCVTLLEAVSVAEPTEDQPAPEAPGRAATVLVRFARWCSENNARLAGEEAIFLARRVSDLPPGADSVQNDLGTCANSSSPEVVQRQATEAYEQAAALLDQFSKQTSDIELMSSWVSKAFSLAPRRQAGRLQESLRTCLEAGHLDAAARLYGAAAVADPSAVSSAALAPARSELQTKGMLPAAVLYAVDELVGRGRHAQAGQLLQRMASVDPERAKEGQYKAAEAVLAKSFFLLYTADNSMAAYVSVPAGWTATKRWPILVAFDTAAANSEGLGRSVAAQRGNRPYIVVAPSTFSNANAVNPEVYEKWYGLGLIKRMQSLGFGARLKHDVPGVLDLLKAVREALAGEDKVYVTGCSGGGIPCYGLMFADPPMIAAAAPACANYHGHKAAARGGAGGPVLQLLGGADPYNEVVRGTPGLIPQNDRARSELRGRGWSVEREVVPGVGHNPMIGKVLQFFDSVREKAGTRDPG